ncbi:VacJ family lipoprotein [Falsihalocynthiibacter sp. BN13B15]|uniref:MlaA family lipoprotein n=1 Tax=Falsihalocynthiibacter sp. BN13B15 TaxID=3240871 RepID=UPI003510228A
MSLLSSCAHPERTGEIYDPYEKSNRARHENTKQSDQGMIGPVAQAYGKTPEFLRTTVTNFSDYLALYPMVGNNLLQFNLAGAAQNSTRLLVNTTFGLAGLFDVASDMGIYEDSTGFGDTLAVWGVGEGAYLEAPFLGPTTQRDAVGGVVDLATNPMFYSDGGRYAAVGLLALLGAKLDKRFRYSGSVDQLFNESADSYVQTRMMYLQNRRYELGQEVAPSADGCTNGYADPYEDPYADPYADPSASTGSCDTE